MDFNIDHLVHKEFGLKLSDCNKAQLLTKQNIMDNSYRTIS